MTVLQFGNNYVFSSPYYYLYYIFLLYIIFYDCYYLKYFYGKNNRIDKQHTKLSVDKYVLYYLCSKYISHKTHKSFYQQNPNNLS